MTSSVSVLSRKGKKSQISQSEINARIDCAAAHRLADAFGWTQLIYNHVTLRVPDERHHFLIKPHGLMWNEVKASDLIKLDLDGNAVDESSDVNASGYAIHAAILKARPDVNAIIHVHTDAGMAISAHKAGLRYITQAAMRFYNRIGYHNYEGMAEAEEGPALVRDLRHYKGLILRNHGLLTCSDSMREAVSAMHYLLSACRSQLLLEAAGEENILTPSPDLCEHAAKQWDEYSQSGALAEWPAMLRWMDRVDPSFRK